ncbi:hypothetical protein M5585_16775 [Serratia ureilytica]
MARRDAGIEGGGRIVVVLQPQVEQQVVMAVEYRPEGSVMSVSLSQAS